MSQRKKKIEGRELRLTMDELKGKQSVRATFRLSQQAIDLLSVIARQLGIKQKSLFDQLIEDTSTLSQVAQEARTYSPEKKARRQKTFVISRNSLVSLDYIAKQQQIPRDVLVEVSIKRLLPVIKTELEKHKKRKILLRDMEGYLEQGKSLLEKAGDLLSEDDSVYEMIKNQVNLCERNVATIDNLVEKGMPMEEW